MLGNIENVLFSNFPKQNIMKGNIIANKWSYVISQKSHQKETWWSWQRLFYCSKMLCGV